MLGESRGVRVGRNWRYFRYVVRHKWFVLVASRRTGAPLWNAVVHDLSKFSRSEWSAYVWSFFGPWSYSHRPPWLRDAFSAAWLHHVHHNPHHWEHWVTGKGYPLAMPEPYVREMVADWMSAGRTKFGPTANVRWWYAKHREGLNLHPATRLLVERIIANVREL